MGTGGRELVVEKETEWNGWPGNEREGGHEEYEEPTGIRERRERDRRYRRKGKPRAEHLSAPRYVLILFSEKKAVC